jgi:transposase
MWLPTDGGRGRKGDNARRRKDYIVEQQEQPKTPRTRRSYSLEFKQSAVDLVLKQGYSCREAARRLGIAENNILNWKQQLARRQALATEGSLEAVLAENKQLKERARRLELECEILKKAATYFAAASQPDLALSVSTNRNTRSV